MTDYEEYDIGPFCKHWGEPGDCEDCRLEAELLFVAPVLTNITPHRIDNEIWCHDCDLTFTEAGRIRDHWDQGHDLTWRRDVIYRNPNREETQ